MAERKSFIIILIGSFLIGILALLASFYQRFLFLKLEDEERIHNGQDVSHPFETSGWVFFGIIIASGIVRFFIFNVRVS